MKVVVFIEKVIKFRIIGLYRGIGILVIIIEGRIWRVINKIFIILIGAIVIEIRIRWLYRKV